MKKTMISRLLLSTVLLLLAIGCATSPGVKETATDDALPVITDIRLQGSNLSIASNKSFVYTLYTGNDPYKTTIEIPDMLAGSFTSKILLERSGVSEVIPQQIESPKPSMKFEVIFQVPSSVMPMYSNNVLMLEIKPEETAPAPRVEETVPVAMEEPAPPVVQEVAGAAGTTTEEVKVTDMPKATAITRVEILKDDGAVRVVIKGNGKLKPNVFPIEGRIVVDLHDVVLKASLPSGAVAPLKGIRAGKHKDKVRLVLDLKEKTRFDVASDGDTLEISLGKKDMTAARQEEKAPAEAEKVTTPKEAPYAEPAAKEAPAITGDVSAPQPAAEKMVASKSLNPNGAMSCPMDSMKDERRNYDFQDADVGSLVRFFAETGGCNYVIDPNEPAIKGKRVTLQLKDVTWERALSIILNNQKLGYRIDENILWVASENTFEAMAKEKAKAKETAEDIEMPLEQEVLRISYMTAKDMQAAITSTKLLSKRGQITVDERMNTLIVRETPKSIEKIRELLKIMDVAKPQVMIEAKIVQVSSNYSEALGIRWGGQFFGSSVINPMNGSFSVNTPTVGAGPSASSPGGTMAMTIGHANSVNVNLSLSALESVKKAKTLSNPKVMTLDNENAKIQQGQTFFISTVSQSGTQTQQQQATLSLDVTPKITPDGYIQLKIKATDNALVSVNPPVVDTKSLETQALVKNGETLVLGGIYKTSVSENEDRIPLLGKVPGLGWLFKTKNVTGPDVIELLIFITPTTVHQQI